MQLSPYLDILRNGLAAAAAAGGEQERAVAERLVAPLDANAQLALLRALSAAADEITAELAPGSVEVRLRGEDVGFAVSLPSEMAPQMMPSSASPEPSDEPEGAAVARINLRLPENLKSRVEQAAAQARMSVNAWLVRAVSNALDPSAASDAGQVTVSVPKSGQRFQGWVR
jgi:HicB family